MFREYVWACSLTSAQLAVSSESSPDYEYVLELPADCLRLIRFLIPDSRTDSVVYARRGSSIHYNGDEVTILYTKDVPAESDWDQDFTNAFVERMAADIALPLSMDPAIAASHEQKFFFMAARADQTNLSESQVPLTEDDSLITARSW
jgi:hypothetical protein